MHPHKSTTHEERYVHIIAYKATEDVPKHIFEKYIAHTVFFRKEEAPDGHKRWYASASHCVHADQFTRRTGRTVARRRYFAKKGVVWVLGTESPNYEDAVDLLNRGLV